VTPAAFVFFGDPAILHRPIPGTGVWQLGTTGHGALVTGHSKRPLALGVISLVTLVWAGNFAAGRYANVAAALSTEGYGAVAPMPRRAEVEAAIKAGRG